MIHTQASRRRGSRAPEIYVELSAGFGHVILIATPDHDEQINKPKISEDSRLAAIHWKYVMNMENQNPLLLVSYSTINHRLDNRGIPI